MEKPIILSLGGSLIVPQNQVDHQFLKDFKEVIVGQIHKGRRFIIVVGGGGICRHYQQAAQLVGPLEKIDVDWLGIHVTHLNGHLLRTIFRQYAHIKVVTHYNRKEPKFTQSVMVAAGWKPGHSTDYDAVRQAILFESDTVINLSNVDYVYDKDPKEHKDAKAFKNLSWKRFLEMFGSTWKPGSHTPFDPIASKLAQRKKVRVVVMNGKNLENFENFLEGNKFEGTVIE
jgi:uridylate kinase